MPLHSAAKKLVLCSRMPLSTLSKDDAELALQPDSGPARLVAASPAAEPFPRQSAAGMGPRWINLRCFSGRGTASAASPRGATPPEHGVPRVGLGPASGPRPCECGVPSLLPVNASQSKVPTLPQVHARVRELRVRGAPRCSPSDSTSDPGRPGRGGWGRATRGRARRARGARSGASLPA
jgi:hypothetical protein